MAAPIEINHISYAKNADPFALTNVLYSILTPGVVYDLKRRTVIDPGPTGPKRALFQHEENVPRRRIARPERFPTTRARPPGYFTLTRLCSRRNCCT